MTRGQSDHHAVRRVLIASENVVIRIILAHYGLTRGIDLRIATTPREARHWVAPGTVRLILFTNDATGRAAVEAGHLSAHLISSDISTSASRANGDPIAWSNTGPWRQIHALCDALLDGSLVDLAPPFRALPSDTQQSSPEPSCHGAQPLGYQNVSVCIDTGIVLVDGEPVDLPPAPRRMLIHMLWHRGRVITLEDFRNRVLRRALAAETLRTHISTLRQRLGRAGDLIETTRGGGYGIGLTKCRAT
jgi:hypothetical protein